MRTTRCGCIPAVDLEEIILLIIVIILLEPQAEYEKLGAAQGIVYPCGAVVKEGRLLVYYGGADKIVGVAYAELDEFVAKLMANGEVKKG